jgi:hypothetical protein
VCAVDQHGLTLNTPGEGRRSNRSNLTVCRASGGTGRMATASGASISLAGASFTMCAWIQTTGKAWRLASESLMLVSL